MTDTSKESLFLRKKKKIYCKGHFEREKGITKNAESRFRGEMRICGKGRGFPLNPTRDLPGGISCPAFYYQGLCVVHGAARLPIGQFPGRVVGNSYTFFLGLRRISFFQCLFQVGRTLEPDTSYLRQASSVGA